MKNPIITVTLILVLNICLLHAEWKSIGLSEHTINCVLYGGGTTLAATNKGLYVQYTIGSKWLNIPHPDSVVIPAKNVVWVDNSQIAVTFNSGTKSDGLFMGSFIWGPPFWVLSSIDFLDQPTALYYDGHQSNTPLLYAGNAKSIYVSRYNLSSQQFDTVTSLYTPPFAFGVEQPFCADIQMYSRNGRLFTGGFDRSSINPGNGNLLWQKSRDSMMVIVPKLKVTAITEEMPRDCVTTQIYFGTKDSGIFYFSPIMSHPPVKFCESPNDEPVIDLVAAPPLQSPRPKTLFAAVKSGVYFKCLPKGAWKKLGNLSYEPTCLAVDRFGLIERRYTVYAGTSRGIFSYESLTVPIIMHKRPSNTKTLQIIPIDKNRIMVKCNSTRQKSGEMTILNCLGKTVFQGLLTHKHQQKEWIVNLEEECNHRLSDGVYLVKVAVGTDMASTRIIITQ